MRRRTTAAALLAVAALGLGACGGDAEDPIEQSVREQAKLAESPAATTTATTPGKAGPTIQKLDISTDLKKKPEIAQPSGDPPNELYSRDIVTGTGKAAKTGENVSVQYVGVSFSDGKQFDASWDRDMPFDFQLGKMSVIKGWDEGVVGMKKGGRRLLVIPADLAYGAQGQGSIGPNETLMFVIDLEKVS